MNMLIGSLDIGIRNLGFCIYNTETNSIQHVEVIDLLRVRGSKRRLPFGDLSVLFLVKRMVADRAALFQQCTYIGIEKQMSRKMILIQFCLEAVLDQCCEVFQISPRCVKSMFGTSRGKHAANKRAAIVKMYELIDADARRIINESFPKKKDDVADAILQAFYVAEHVEALRLKKKIACTVARARKRKRSRAART